MKRKTVSLIAQILLLALVYLAAAKVGLSLASLHKNVTPVWPLFMTALAIWGAWQGYGPFAQASPNLSLILLISFAGTSALMTIVVAAVTNERRRAEADAVQAASERTELLQRESQARREAEWGLAIVRHLVELHGETVSADNRNENGGAVPDCTASRRRTYRSGTDPPISSTSIDWSVTFATLVAWIAPHCLPGRLTD